jgi:hypothetical protein
MNSLGDASALLWRLWLRKIDLADRWRSLADRWGTRPLAGARAFYLMHAIIAFAVTGRDTAVSRTFAALPRPSDPRPRRIFWRMRLRSRSAKR